MTSSRRARASGTPRAAYLSALRQLERPVDEVLRRLEVVLSGGDDEVLPPVPSAAADPWLLGQALEVLTQPQQRTVRGAHFTPPNVARMLAARGVELLGRAPRQVLDPACGGGAFLLAAATAAPGAHVIGWDVDERSVRTSQASLRLLGAHSARVDVGDALVRDLDPAADLVLGNPPFLSQLSRETARAGGRRAVLNARFSSAAKGYVDEAALFVLATASRWLAPGGVGVLILPESLLVTRDAADVRRGVDALADMQVVWRDAERVFPGVPTCAIALRRRPSEAAPEHQKTTWAAHLAVDVPALDVASAGPLLGDVATATADFRDAYYLIAEHVTEGQRDGPHPKITTVGSIDPAVNRWGTVATRFAKQRWERPVAPGLPEEFWAARSGAKLLVATQTKVLECVVDTSGDMLPTTPVITVRGDQLWHLGAALTSPALTVIAARRHAGAARSRGALKLGAKDLRGLPLPTHDLGAWDRAADAFRTAHDAVDDEARLALLRQCGEEMLRAYGHPPETPEGEAALRWWWERLSSRRSRSLAP